MANTSASLALDALSDPISPIAIGSSVSSPSARARFEFEATGKGNNGSKVLMIEWEEDDTTKDIQGTWTVHWDGMPAQRSSTVQYEDLGDGEESVVSMKTSCSRSEASDGDVAEANTRSPMHRRYFFMGPKKSMPATVSITLIPSAEQNVTARPVTWKTNPLPAIFPKPLVGEEPGKLGVLHTRWATMRLKSLDREIESEAQEHAEGVALEMALSEREWIVEKFGVGQSRESETQTLADKLGRLESDQRRESDEVAIPLCAKKVEKLMTGTGNDPLVATAKSLQSVNIDSSATTIDDKLVGMGQTQEQTARDEDELFALPLSPRSPEMVKMPFSFVIEPRKTN